MKPNSTVKEQSLNPQPVRSKSSATAAEGLDERVLATLHAAGEKKALEPVVLDLREIASFTDYFVIVSGANERQVQAISDEIYESLKKSGHAAARVEGYKTAEWILQSRLRRASENLEMLRATVGSTGPRQPSLAGFQVFRCVRRSHRRAVGRNRRCRQR
jgi:ribosome silencing factor RsfS/YbeB/iojap